MAVLALVKTKRRAVSGGRLLNNDGGWLAVVTIPGGSLCHTGLTASGRIASHAGLCNACHGLCEL